MTLRVGALVFVLVAAAALPLVSARADDSATLKATTLLVGQQATLVLEVIAPAGALVELDPAHPGWDGVEVIRLTRQTETPQSDGQVLHRIEVVVAPFLPGERPFEPAVNIVAAGVVSPRTLPPVRWNVIATVPDGAPLELSPLAASGGIAGAESPWLRPGLALAALAAAAALFAAIARLAQWLRSRPPRAAAPAVELRPVADLGSAETLLDEDPVRAYRSLAVTVRGALGQRYAFPAHAMTTHELQRRMETFGVDRWQARLVTGLLEECDAVVYAGYRPAAERRRADLTMAREIVEAVG